MNEPYVLWMNKYKEMEHLAQAKETKQKMERTPKEKTAKGKGGKKDMGHKSNK